MGEKIGLVLEGGGFRGLYSEGVIETLLEKNIKLPYVIGVSMGAVVGSSYLSGQKRRNYDIAMTYVDDTRYLSFRNLLTQGGMFGMDFVFGDLAYELIPFDFDTFDQTDQELVIGAMRCDTGQTDYFYKSKMATTDFMKGMRASCSLPFLSRMVTVNGCKYLDGGVSDSIPYKKAFEDGCDKVIVILTRDEAYRRKPFGNHRLGALVYRDYPAVLEEMEQRHIRYHQSLDALMALEKAGKALVIRPPKPVGLGRLEKDRAKLRATYMMGYNQGKELAEVIEGFVNGMDKSQGVVAPSYDIISMDDLDRVQPLWENLQEIHTRLSPDFSDSYKDVSFKDFVRRMHKLQGDDVRIALVNEGNEVVGYSIASVNRRAKVGQLDSIFLKPAYRKMGIGEKLIEDSKTWMLGQGSKELVLDVVVGNEGVLSFYKKTGFYPERIKLTYKG